MRAPPVLASPLAIPAPLAAPACLAILLCLALPAGAPAARASEVLAPDTLASDTPPSDAAAPGLSTRAPSAPELAWHACLRAAYARQPGGQSRAASQRGALDACREHEDRTVAAAMAAADEKPDGARAWVSGWAAALVDPVAAWIGALRR